MTKSFGDPKNVKGGIKLSLTSDELSSTDLESNLIRLYEILKTRECTVRIDRISHKDFTKLKSRLFTLKRKRFIVDYYFNLDEDSKDLYSGSLVMCYNKV